MPVSPIFSSYLTLNAQSFIILSGLIRAEAGIPAKGCLPCDLTRSKDSSVNSFQPPFYNMAIFIPVTFIGIETCLFFWGFDRAETNNLFVDGRHLFGTGKPVDGGVNSIINPPAIFTFYALLHSMAIIRYTDRTNAKSFEGITTPDNCKAPSHSNVNVAFFAPVIFTANKSLFLWVLIGSETDYSVKGRHLCGTGKPVDGCGESITYPPNSITTELGGYENNLPTKVFIMATKAHKPQEQQPLSLSPESYFAINPTINLSPNAAIEPLHTVLIRAQSILSLLQENGHDLNEGFSFDQATIMNVLWSLDAQIAQGLQLIEGVSHD